MKKKAQFTPIKYSALPDLFQKIEMALAKKKQTVGVVVIGGLAIIAQRFRQRATLDIDIAQNRDAGIFVKICNQLAIPVDVITVSSTVDLNQVPTMWSLMLKLN